MKRRKKIAEIIKSFVEENYGWAEADHPSWNINALAKEIDDKLQKETNNV